MTTAVKAIYEGGVFKPIEPFQLEDLTQVEVLIPLGAFDARSETADELDDLIGFIRSAPANMAEHHDQYLYPKHAG